WLFLEPQGPSFEVPQWAPIQQNSVLALPFTSVYFFIGISPIPSGVDSSAPSDLILLKLSN
ncbi:MAG: hypothetical protein ACTSW7_03225, partial [Candidatus Thorarchaeota archaeon]